MSQENILFKSKEFTLTQSSLVQGTFVSKAVAEHCIQSNYESPIKESDVLAFKFSINNKDNEMAPGLNHKMRLKCIPNQAEEINTVFGSLKDTASLIVDENKVVPENTPLKIKVDLNPILKSFIDKGFYETATGEKIYKNDFKRICIAGGTEALSWDFANLHNKGLELTDINNDGIYEGEVILNKSNGAKSTAKEWKLSSDISDYPRLKSGSVMLDALYNMALDETKKNIEKDGTFRTGKEWEGVWTRDLSYSILLGIGIIEPQICKTGLMRKVKRKRIIQDTGTGGAWPVSSDRVVWADAAFELFKVTGDYQWLNEIHEIIKNTLEDDLKTIADQETGLMKGESSFMDWRKQSYPDWMNSIDIYNSLNLGTNAVHCRAYEVLAEIAGLLHLEDEKVKYAKISEKIKASINAKLWLTEKGYYSEYLYGREKLSLSPKSETLGEALAILYNIAPVERQQSIMRHLPVLPFGVPCFYPQISGISSYHNNAIWPFVQAFYNLASAKANSITALEHGLAAFYRPAALFLTNKENFVASTGDYRDTEINSDRQLWSIAANFGMVYKIFFGLEYGADHLAFHPVVPKSYSGNIEVTHFKYRKAVLNIVVKGFGNKIFKILLDGKPLKSAVIEANLMGNHSIEIALDCSIPALGDINLVNNEFALPTPVLTLNKRQVSWPKLGKDAQYVLLVNGIEKARTRENTFTINDQEKNTIIQVKAIAPDGNESFYSAPLYCENKQDQIFIEAEQVAIKSGLAHKGFSGSGFVELTKESNKEISFEISVMDSGAYFVDFRYANGSGPFNTDNKCAIRSLYLNGDFVGAAVFPQIGQDEWSSFGYSNFYRVHLNKGNNNITLKFENANENMNGTINTALLDGLRVRKVYF